MYSSSVMKGKRKVRLVDRDEDQARETIGRKAEKRWCWSSEMMEFTGTEEHFFFLHLTDSNHHGRAVGARRGVLLLPLNDRGDVLAEEALAEGNLPLEKVNRLAEVSVFRLELANVRLHHLLLLTLRHSGLL